jgi:hypothetical protein
MSDVYKQHDATFRGISAWVILKDGERVATFAVKYNNGGANGVTVTAYLHVLGLPMVRFREGPGGGYDMKSAAFSRAAAKAMRESSLDVAEIAHQLAARNVLADFSEYPDAGDHWDGWLSKRGYQVEQAV